MPRTILITGATGQQGGATLRALTESTRLSDGLSIRLLALTRNSSSQKANALLSIPGVQVVQGDLRDKSSISKIFESYAIDSVFGVQDIFQGNEVEQGTTLVDVAVTYGVKQFVYTSVDMSGLSPSPIPHFETKRQIEEHLKARSSQSQMVYTILRPSAFFGNFYWPPYRLSMGTKWNPNQRFKHIVTSDIGRAAAEILIAGSQEEKFRNRIINLTGDAHTPDEIRKIFQGG